MDYTIQFETFQCYSLLLMSLLRNRFALHSTLLFHLLFSVADEDQRLLFAR